MFTLLICFSVDDSRVRCMFKTSKYVRIVMCNYVYYVKQYNLFTVYTIQDKHLHFLLCLFSFVKMFIDSSRLFLFTLNSD